MVKFFDGSDPQLEPFLIDYDELKIPVIRNGQSVWTNHFSINKIEEIRVKSGMNKFASQMMLEPISYTESFFNLSLIKFYEADVVRAEVNRVLMTTLDGKNLKFYSCYWDPAFGSKDGDGSVIVIIFIDEFGHFYLHDIKYLNRDDDENSAMKQVVDVIDFLKLHTVNAVSIETNGIGKFLPDLLRDKIADQRLNIRVNEVNNHISKEMRIIDAIDAPLSAGFLYFHESVRRSRLIAEMEEWNPNAGRAGNIDDGLDALAGAVLANPVKISALRQLSLLTSRQFRTYRAKSNFDV